MENNLNKALEGFLANSGVTGVLCADKQGLCLSAKGEIDCLTAGPAVKISQQALLLEPGKVPILRLESDSKEFLIQNNGNMTIALTRNSK